MARFKEFKQFQIRILVTTNLFSRRMDIERADIIFNYDMPQDTDTYLQRVCVTKEFLFVSINHFILGQTSIWYKRFSNNICC